jgi:hypothetical protein
LIWIVAELKWIVTALFHHCYGVDHGVEHVLTMAKSR